MVLALLLTIGIGLLVPALGVAVAYLFFGDVRGDADARTAPGPAAVDPNEAARAVGSWG